MGSCQSSPRSTATPLCHLPPSEVTFSSASFLFESIPAQLPGAQGQQSFIKASLSSPCFGDIVLWISPSAQPLFKPSGKTLKSLSLKTKAPGAAATGRGNRELITHPEHSPGCSHSAQASSSIPSRQLHPRPRREQTHGTEKQPKPQIQHGLAPDPSLGWKREHVGRGGGQAFHENPLCFPAFKADKELSVEERCLCDDLFPWSLQAPENKAVAESHRSLWAAGNAAVPSLRWSSGVSSGFRGVLALFC